MSDLALIVGGAISSFGFGWGLGKTIKSVRQFFDLL